MKLIAGLGNPGRLYASHRHNVGFCVVDLISERLKVEITKRMFGAFVGKCKIAGEDVMLAKPQTFMNLSGDAVAPLLGYYKIEVGELIVIHDDVDIDLGRMKIARGQGHGGHNGVKSIAESLGDSGFYRVRMGVGRPPEFMDTANYVLQPFSREEAAIAKKLVADAADAVEMLLEAGLEKTQMRYH